MDIDRVVREAERLKITGRSRATWWLDEKSGNAPKRIRIGANAVGWRLSELMEWLQTRDRSLSPRPVAIPSQGKRRGRPRKVVTHQGV